VWEIDDWYDAYMTTQLDKQARDIIERVRVNPHGHSLQQFLRERGYNLWQSSILVSKMVKDGRLAVTRGKNDTSTGHTWRKIYAVTTKGAAWAATSEVKDVIAQVDIEPALERAMETRKWTALPDGVVWDDVVRVGRRRGFEARVFVRFAEGN
jgi:DNA-binding PadR family transcriptional regulator